MGWWKAQIGLKRYPASKLVFLIDQKSLDWLVGISYVSFPEAQIRNVALY